MALLPCSLQWDERLEKCLTRFLIQVDCETGHGYGHFWSTDMDTSGPRIWTPLVHGYGHLWFKSAFTEFRLQREGRVPQPVLEIYAQVAGNLCRSCRTAAPERAAHGTEFRALSN